LYCLFRLFNAHTVKKARIHKLTRRTLGIRSLLYVLAACNYLDYRQIEFFCKFPVARVVRGHRHYSARTVGYKHVIRNKYRNFLAVYGVYCGNAVYFNARFILSKLCTLKVGLFGSLLLICRNLVHIGYFIRPFIYKRVLGRHYHIGNAEKRIRTGGKYLERIAYVG